MKKGALRPLSFWRYFAAQPQLPHWQQRHSTHLHPTHLQQAQVFGLVSGLPVAFPRTRRACRGARLSDAGTPPCAVPYCGWLRTTLENVFGPTQCRSIQHCADCRQPFESFKPL